MRPFALLVVCSTFAFAQDDSPRPVLDTGGHTGTATGIGFAGDGKFVVTASLDKTVRVWDLSSGDTARVIRLPIGPGREGSLLALSVAPNGRTVAVAGHTFGNGKHGHLIYLLDLQTGQIARTLDGHKGAITSLAFGPSGTRLASASADKTLRVYDVATGRMESTLEGHTTPVRQVAFGPGGDRVASIGDDGLRLWTISTGKADKLLADGESVAGAIAWSPDGKTIVRGNTDGSLSLWNPDGTLRHKFTDLATGFRSLSFTPDSKELLATGTSLGDGENPNSRFARLIDLATGGVRIAFPHHTGPVEAGAISADGKWAVSAGGDQNDGFVWRTADASVVQPLYSLGLAAFTVGWRPDGKGIGFGRRGTLERGLAFADMKIDLKPVTDGYLKAQLVRDDKALEVRDGKLVAIDDDQVLATFQPAGDRITCATWLDDGLALAGGTNGVYLFDTATKKIVREYQSHVGEVVSIATDSEGLYFVTGSRDQTVRIWAPDKKKPLLSFAFTFEDWVAWTEEGVYSCSTNGERLIGWQVNDGPDRVGRYTPANQFRRSLFKPAVIAKLLEAGSLEKAFELAEVERPAELNVNALRPPLVDIVSPTGIGVARVSRTFEVKVNASSVGKHPVTALRLLVNGRPYGGSASLKTVKNPVLGAVTESWTVELPPGPYSLMVAADCAVSRSVSAPVAIQVPGPAGADERPALYVLAVGVNDYPDPAKLRYAAPDADAIAKAFQTNGAKTFRKIETKVLKDKDATAKGIEAGLAWLAERMTPQDIAVFSFSGHGCKDWRGDLSLLPHDVDLLNTDHTGVSGSLLKKALADMPGRVLVLLDACHAGLAAERGAGSATDDLVRDLVSEDYGAIVMTSSRGTELSAETSALKQGIFTAAVVEALNGHADLNKDGAVMLWELERYVTSRVRTLSRGAQTPITVRPTAVRGFEVGRKS